jgi:hypothetical protein
MAVSAGDIDLELIERTSIISAANEVFSGAFRDRKSWASWFSFMKTMFGLRMGAKDLALFQHCTSRQAPRSGGYKECWVVVGRRGGKSFILGYIATYLAIFRNWFKYLQSGERATILVVASDRKQGRVIFRYILGLLKSTPETAAMVERDTADQIYLVNQISIEIATASYRSLRGYSVAACLCDEIAFWRSEESANPDEEVIAAVRPAMSNLPGSVLLCASSPYSRRGAMWNAYKRHFGKEDSATLVWQAETRAMNPSIDQSIIDDAMEADEASALAEYGARFRLDIDSLISREAIDAVTVRSRIELPPVRSNVYHGFCDPSGGSSDSMTLGIAHNEYRGGVDYAVLDALLEVKPPFSPAEVVSAFSAMLNRYWISTVIGDRYAGEWTVEAFAKRGIEYTHSDESKSELYVNVLPHINSRRVELLDHKRMADQLVSLERRTGRGTGRDTVDHPPGGHDDVANAASGALWQVLKEPDLSIWTRM